MKQNSKYNKSCEYLPEIIADRIDALAKKNGGRETNTRFDNYLKILGTIYYKCMTENGYAHIPHPLASDYWKKTIGGYYKDYKDELLNDEIIEESNNKGRLLHFNIEMNLTLFPGDLIQVNIPVLEL